jgi:Tfp pilus assembly protein PilF
VRGENSLIIVSLVVLSGCLVPGCSDTEGQIQDQAKKCLARADEALARGDNDKAIADCTEAIRLDPKLGNRITVGG